jgi:hypothetical protein
MRVFLKASFPVTAGNRAMADGSIVKIIQSILDELKPEASYFLDDGGERTAYLFCDLKDTSQIPALPNLGSLLWMPRWRSIRR